MNNLTNCSAPTSQKITREDGKTIAYHFTPGKSPGVVFLTGFVSDMNGDKALCLEEFCQNRGQAFLRFDYTGHGESSEEFLEGCIGDWAGDTIYALDLLTKGPQILIGSSMGGWIMLLTALARPERIAGLVGIAAAPDFTEDLMWADFTPEQKEALEQDGRVAIGNDYDDGEDYIITQKLIEDGRKNLLLRSEIALDCPVRLIHGLQDKDVPWTTSQKISERLRSTDVETTFVKNGDHRLSEPQDLDRLRATLRGLLKTVEDS
ncbi:MAG: alpha/beta hydrolase [Rhodospirillales bacterium]|jgi:pimeloyl-ACP methyl ester carboxylesterase|nr:alpha/beta hydrolase [Alphaproteobacteria bacterium]MBT8001768.1 alpha/beta hydrolase [Rhodospirillales bacterium]